MVLLMPHLKTSNLTVNLEVLFINMQRFLTAAPYSKSQIANNGYFCCFQYFVIPDNELM